MHDFGDGVKGAGFKMKEMGEDGSSRALLRQSFPLHYIVFRQTAAHLPHEANSEQLFSRAGTLSDDNGKMDPHRLAVWTSIGVNYSTYKPTDEEILTRYLLKFSKGGKATAAELHQDDLGLLDPSGDSDGYLVQACDKAASGAIEL